MPKVKITYLEHTDPKQRGTAGSTKFLGRDWERGTSQEVELDGLAADDAALVAKLRKNPTWIVEDLPDEEGPAKRGPGRPPKGLAQDGEGGASS